LRPILGIAVALVGYGSVVSIILFESRRRKKQVQSIIADIRARGKKVLL